MAGENEILDGLTDFLGINSPKVEPVDGPRVIVTARCDRCRQRGRAYKPPALAQLAYEGMTPTMPREWGGARLVRLDRRDVPKGLTGSHKFLPKLSSNRFGEMARAVWRRIPTTGPVYLPCGACRQSRQTTWSRLVVLAQRAVDEGRTDFFV